MPVPETDVATLISDGGHATLQTDMWRGPVRPAVDDVPVNAVFVMQSGGLPPHRISRAAQIRTAGVKIRVRNSGYLTGLTLAKAILDTVDESQPTGYMDVSAIQTEPIFLTKDRNGDYHWSMNFYVMYEV